MSPSHAGLLAELATGQVREVFRMVRERLRSLSREPGIRSTVAFENSGPESGGTLFHPHLQVVALPEIPPTLADELAGAGRYAHRHGGVCAFEAEVAREREETVRMVVDSPKIVAYAPFASGHPYEMRLVPVRHAPSWAEATDSEVERLAELVPRLLRAVRDRLPDVSYNLISRGVPPTAPEARSYHWHVDLVPRAVRPDGFEVGSGIPVNPVPPEVAAEELRERLDHSVEVGPGRPDP